ncbi:MAG: BREX system P-loop protein BrxC, partial [Spirochaetia bacterium]|nr:BREX system P-loop protein BrxC [Spirochaetia bacterium]
DGVIKADDELHAMQEVEEYVITQELKKHLGKLVDGYIDSIDKVKKNQTSPYNGVWISGYFGSGKSHLLKMLAYLFENRETAGSKVSDIFINKIDDQFIKANIRKMLDVPSKSILFNIDQLSDAAQASADNAILFIFEKVFNRMIGYFPENRNISEFERHLDEEGIYGKFKEDYQRITGRSWQESRSKSFGIGLGKLVQVLVEGSGMHESDARGLVENYRQPAPLSVESFAKRVKSFLDNTKDKNYRLNFFIDEVGQFIAKKARLMLQLQTIAETLATVCGGRVWIFVTSQEDLQSVVGDPTAKQVQDYSKIHARFYFRISLSSTDVQEVIQKRLLDKNPEGAEMLSEFYMKEKETLRTLFRFEHGGKDIQFKDRDQFVLSYPFQAYQYNLLQQGLRGLSEHNAFMGRHVSRGERSMLEIFQDVAKSLKDEKLFCWATFDRMFNGIRETLNTALLSAVNVAERNLANPLAVKILKILLLVKYVRDFKATVEHLKVLLITSLDMDLAKLENEIIEALNILEHQTYIQKNGQVYEYLTNEEKDVEEEIKNVDVANDEVREFVSDMVFSGILRSAKIRFNEIDEDYAYRKMVDGETVGRSAGADLAIHLVTPFHPNFDDRSVVLNHSMGKSEMIVFLDGKDFFYRELKLYFQTDIYCRHAPVSDGNSQLSRIINDKQQQNSERKKDINDKIKELIGKADIYIVGDILTLKMEDPKARLETAFQSLVKRVYPKLRMLKNHYVESSLKKILYPDDSSALYGNGAGQMDEAQTELFGFIQRKYNLKENLSLKMLYEEFSSKQYGWYFWGISCVLAKLFVRDAVEFAQSSRNKSRDDVYALLSVQKEHDQVRVIPAPVVSADQLDDLKKLYSSVFHKNMASAKAKDAAAEFKKAVLEEAEEIETWQRTEMEAMPFLISLSPVVKTLKEIAGRDESYILQNIDDYRDDLLVLSGSEIDPLKAFMSPSGTQSSTWKSIRRWFETGKDNLSELGLESGREKMDELLKDIPYKDNILRNAIRLYDDLKKAEEKALKEKSDEGKKQIEKIKASLSGMKEYHQLPPEKQISVCEPFNALVYGLEDQKRISDIRNISENRAKKVLEDVKKTIHALVNPEKKITYATEPEKKISFEKSELVTESDVEIYSEKLKRHYLDLVRQNKRIGL